MDILKTHMLKVKTKTSIPENSSAQPKFEYLQAFAEFETSEAGLSDDEVDYRLRKYGQNTLVENQKKSLILEFIKEFKDVMVIILIIAATIALFANEITDALVIYSIVLINGIIGFRQKFQAEKAVNALKKMVEPQARVLRHGRQFLIETANIVPGDILIVNEGDQISADGLVIESNEFMTNEATLTGESASVIKLAYNLHPEAELAFHKTNTVFMGTSVAHGNAKIVVTKTGMQTEFGKIANLTQKTKHDRTPLEKEIQQIGIFSAKITLAFTAILLFISIFVYQKPLLETIIYAASIAVAAVPEGLPATITIALAFGVQRLSRQKAIIKQLSSVETLGTTTVICSNKTGTLTQNEMTVAEMYTDQHFMQVDGSGYQPEGEIHIYERGKEVDHKYLENNPLQNSIELINLCGVLCNNSNLKKVNDQYTISGNPTEGALLTLANKFNFSPDQINSEFQRLHEFSFDSNRKLMTVVVQNLKTGKIFVFTKGAPENIIKICDQRLSRGRPTILTKENRNELEAIHQNYGERALRTLAFAFKELPAKSFEKLDPSLEFPLNKYEAEKNLTFIGFTAMIDPPRPEVRTAIEMTKKAGIKTYMVTGDYGLTAKAIAENLGLATPESGVILTGEELSQMTIPELQEKLKARAIDYIFARISPEHKLMIVSALKENGEIVAMTGDGVNDAPALKHADIGVAGLTGTDVSKEAANMVLADDSYSTIVIAIKEGRAIYENLKKFIYFIFSSNLGGILTIFFAIIFNLPSPFTAILILSVNLATDMLPALALNYEPAEKNILEKPPRSPSSRIMEKEFIQRLLFIGISIACIVTGAFITKLISYGWSWQQPISLFVYQKALSVSFGTIVLVQVFNSLNARSEKFSIFQIPFFSNPKLLWALLSSVIITVSIIELPWLQQIMNTTHLQAIEWLMVIGFSFAIIPIEEVRKWANMRKSKKSVTVSQI